MVVLMGSLDRRVVMMWRWKVVVPLAVSCIVVVDNGDILVMEGRGGYVGSRGAVAGSGKKLNRRNIKKKE